MAGYATHVSQQRCLTFKSELFNEAINYICYIFGIQSMYEDQEQAIRAFFNGHDIFFSASTGYGKSLVFQSLPFVADYLQEQCSRLSSLLVVSPLQALMEEQVQKMNAIGIPSVALHDKEVGLEEKLNNVKDGVYSLIYTSPECMLEGRYWRQILSSEAFREHCIGVAVDEAHCIAQWGMNDKKQRPFRLWYSQIQELRSLLSGNLKFAIFTATATRSTKQKILDSLEVSPDSLFLIQKDPNRDNIKYAVKYVENKSDIVDIFGPCINLLQHEGEISPRTIIFCQTRKQCALLYSVFSSKLKDKMYAKGKKLPKHRIVEMFHAGTPQSVKSHIIEQMALSGSHLRVLICTVAFGMGIDCKELYSVIHFGPPKNLECYLQESGRIGRDGSPSKSLILYNSFLCSACDSPMRLFLRTKTCRRLQISVSFPKSSENCSVSGCKCCDNCCLSCKCGSESCGSWLEFGHPTLEEQTELRQTRMVSKEQKERLKEGLKSYRLTLLENYSNIKPVSYPNIFVEFDNFQVRQVLEHCDKLFTISDICNYVEIWRQVHANNILAIIEEIFQDTDINVSTLVLTEDEACLDSVDLPQTWIDIRDDTDIPDLLLDSAVAENIDAELSCLDKSDNSYQNIDDVLEPFTSKRIPLSSVAFIVTVLHSNFGQFSRCLSDFKHSYLGQMTAKN